MTTEESKPPEWIKDGAPVWYRPHMNSTKQYAGVVDGVPTLLGPPEHGSWCVRLRNMDRGYRDGHRDYVPAAACRCLEYRLGLSESEMVEKMVEKFGDPYNPKPASPLLRVKRIGDHSLPLPRYHSDGASGIDLATPFDVTVPMGDTLRVPLGFAIEIPPGFEGQIRPRSSLSKRGVLCHFGTIDCDYRGELAATITNTSLDLLVHAFSAGDRVCQLVIAPVARCAIEEAAELSETARGEGGWGSTGR